MKLTVRRPGPTPPELLYPKHNDHLAISQGTDIALDGLTVQGDNTTGDYSETQAFEAGLYLDRCNKVTVTNLTTSQTWGDGFYARGDDITLDGFTVTLNGRQGVAFTRGSRFKAAHGTITYSRRAGIDLEPNTASEVIEDVELGWITLRSRLLGITAGGQGTVRRVHVHDIDLGGTGVPVLNANGNGDRSDWTVERLRHIPGPDGRMPSLGSPAPAMRFAHGNNITIRDCALNFTPGRKMTAIWLNDIGGTVTITGNRFTGAARLVEVVNPRPDLVLILDDNTPEG